MAKKLKTKIGDVFSVPINDSEKRFMQLVAFDLTQLNSDVVRVFKRIYNINETPIISDIINDEILSYAHCATDFGLQLKLWSIFGNSINIGIPSKVMFRGTEDYARKAGEEPKLKSDKWYVWQINDNDFKYVGKLSGKYREAFIGLVFNPYDIIEIAKGNKCPDNYPQFE